jgi:hypothetical protein
MSRLRGVLALGLLAVAVTVSGCQKEAPPPPPPPPAAPMPPPPPPPPPFKVDSLDVGKAVGVDNKLTAPTASFGPKDTIYLSVISEGVAPAVVYRAKWTYGPKAVVVKEESQSIASLGLRATEFHIAKPSGWPLGKYKVELFVDDRPAGLKEFEVVAAKAPVKKK